MNSQSFPVSPEKEKGLAAKIQAQILRTKEESSGKKMIKQLQVPKVLQVKGLRISSFPKEPVTKPYEEKLSTRQESAQKIRAGSKAKKDANRSQSKLKPVGVIDFSAHINSPKFKTTYTQSESAEQVSVKNRIASASLNH